MSYRVRASDPAVAGLNLRELWSRNLGSSCHDPQRRLDWFYLENPAGRGVAHLLEREGESGGPVGCMGIGSRAYSFHGRMLSVALFGDLAVDQKHRSLGPALMLQRATRTYAQEHFPISLGYPNAKALPSVLRQGFRNLGQMVRYAVPLRHRTYVRQRLPEPAATFAAALLDGATMLRGAPALFAAGASFHLESLAAPDARFDDLWQRARGSFAHIAERSSTFLNWRFLRKPGLAACRFYALSRRRTNELVAYAVVERQGRCAYLRDLFGTSSTTIAALLDRLLPALRFEGHVSASFAFFGAPWMVELLTQRRFAPRDHQTVVIDWGTSPPAPPEELMDRNTWFITQADEDG